MSARDLLVVTETWTLHRGRAGITVGDPKMVPCCPSKESLLYGLVELL